MAIPAGLMEEKMMTYRKAGDLHDEALREHAAMMNGIVFDLGGEDGLGMHDGMPEEVK